MKDNKMPIIVVEGKTDVQFLSTFLDVEFVITNGSSVPSSTIDYLKKSVKERKIIVLTDPDFPGKQIRDKLDKEEKYIITVWGYGYKGYAYVYDG